MDIIRGLAQKDEGTNVGAGSPWPQLWAYVNVSGFMGRNYCEFLRRCYKIVTLPTELVTTWLVTTHNPRTVQTL